MDKLEREYLRASHVYFTRENVQKLSVQFPGFAEDELERGRDVLECLRCFASMGRLVLFELSQDESYVFMDVGKIIDVLGKVTAPEQRL